MKLSANGHYASLNVDHGFDHIAKLSLREIGELGSRYSIPNELDLGFQVVSA